MDKSIKLFIKWCNYAMKIPEEESNYNYEKMESTKQHIIDNIKT